MSDPNSDEWFKRLIVVSEKDFSLKWISDHFKNYAVAGVLAWIASRAWLLATTLSGIGWCFWVVVLFALGLASGFIFIANLMQAWWLLVKQPFTRGIFVFYAIAILCGAVGAFVLGIKK
jgi:hypothetical protein